ncbi:MAG: hypothetical protein F6K04_25715, partial [Leptolyngbya sp. SIO4C5]|nr:hypothetical protein [Leptolyngbya sp. SIO4C5]
MRSFLIDRLIENGQVNSSVVPLTSLHSSNDPDSSAPSSRVINTELAISATGALILVVEIEPLKINEIEITHIYEYARYCPDIQPGDLVSVEFSDSELYYYYPGSTTYFKTPYSATCKVSSDEHLRAPENCPTCHSPLVTVDGLDRCLSVYCPSTLVTRIVHWPAWKLFNVEKPDYELAEQLIEACKICSPLNLYTLSFDGLVKKCNLAPERARLIMLALEYSKQYPWPYIVMGFGIRHLRMSDLNKISTAYPSLEALQTTDLKALRQIGFGHTATAKSLAAWLSTPENQEFLFEAKSLFKVSIFTPSVIYQGQSAMAQADPHLDNSNLDDFRINTQRNLKAIKGSLNQINSELKDTKSEVDDRQNRLLEIISDLPLSCSIQELSKIFHKLISLDNSIHEISTEIEEGQHSLRDDIRRLPSHHAIQQLSQS